MGKLWVSGCFLWEARRSDLPISTENSAKTVHQGVRLLEKFRNENQGENKPTYSRSLLDPSELSHLRLSQEGQE